LRRAPVAPIAASDPSLVLRLRLRPPYDADALGSFLAARAVVGLERHEPGGVGWTHRRVVPLPGHPASVAVSLADDHAVVRSDCDLRDTAALVLRVRRWLDLDADPETVGAALAADGVLAPLVALRPGLRVPTTVDPWETVARAIVGQQVTVAGARTLLGRLVAELGGPDVGDLRSFPTPSAVADAGPDRIAALGMPGARARSLHAAATAVASGGIALRTGDVDDVAAQLLALPGIGPWTASYVRLRGLGDPDAFPASDLGLRRAAEALGLPAAARDLEARARTWSPWRSYAAQHLWTRPEETP
jgi:AraC family transcriptional regulator of adaptative response / DNA-3-methyladenine glycosylase II